MAHKWTQKGIEGYRKTHGGRYPPGQEPKVDPSAAWLDSLAASKERIAHGEGGKVDSARVFMGKKPEEPPKDSEILREYLARRKLAIAGGETPTETDKALGIVRKPDKLAKPEGTIKAMVRLSGEVGKQDQMIDEITDRELESKAAEEDLTYPTDKKMMAVAEKIKAVKMDSLQMAENLQAKGYENFSYMIDLLSKIEVPFEEFLRMRQDPAVDPDPVARHMKALGWLMQETGRSIEQIQEILNATGKSRKLAPMAGFND